MPHKCIEYNICTYCDYVKMKDNIQKKVYIDDVDISNNTP